MPSSPCRWRCPALEPEAEEDCPRSDQNALPADTFWGHKRYAKWARLVSLRIPPEISPKLSTTPPLAPEKGQQIGIDRLRVCCRHPVREIFIRLEYAILEQLRR